MDIEAIFHGDDFFERGRKMAANLAALMGGGLRAAPATLGAGAQPASNSLRGAVDGSMPQLRMQDPEEEGALRSGGGFMGVRG